MTAVWYIGAGDRIITAAQWASAGVAGASDNSWTIANGWSVPAASFNPAQIAILNMEPTFNTAAADGPRYGVDYYSFPDTTPATKAYVQSYTDDVIAQAIIRTPPGGIGTVPGFCTFAGGNNNYIQTPDSSPIDIANGLDVRIMLLLGSLTGTGFQTLVSRQSSTQTFWQLRETAAGKLQLQLADGTTGALTTALCTVNTPAAPGFHVTWDKATGIVRFYKSDPVGATVRADGSRWTQLGSDVASGFTGTLYTGPSSAPLTIGAAGNGTASFAASTVFSSLEVRNNLEGTMVASLYMTVQQGFSPLTDAQGNIWTIVGSVPITYPLVNAVVGTGSMSLATVAALTAQTGPTNARNPITKKYQPEKYGNVGATPDATRLAIQAALNACSAAGGGILDLSGGPYVVGPNTTLLDQYGKPYASILLNDNVEVQGSGGANGGIQLAAGANCHVFAHNGRINGAGFQDHIDNVRIIGLKIDGQASLQDQCHDHDGLHLPQFPGLVIENVKMINIDGHAYYSTANGDFATIPSNIGQSSNATVVKPLWLEDVWVDTCARWAYMMSATNRKTHEVDLHAINAGTLIARIAGKKVNPVLTSAGTIYLTFDAQGTIYTVNLASGDNLAAVIGKINTAIGAAGTAAASASNRLMITTATSGGRGYVGVYNDGTHTPTPQVLADLGLSIHSGATFFNGENNSQVGGNEYGGFYADHSEAGTDRWFAEQCLGDGVFWHNVNMCAYGSVETTNNSGYGAVINELNTSKIREIIAGMNCADLGYASYRPTTIRNLANTPIATPKAEILLLAGTVGYGVTANSYIETVIAPGIKSSLGAGADNRYADCAMAIEHGIPSSLILGVQIYGPDGGLNADGLGPNLRDYR